jgi:uncharacterized protein (DUF1778 family)
MPSKPTKPKKRRKAVRKEANIHIRLTEDQKVALEAIAEKSGLGISSWVLMIALREVEKAGGGGA